MAADPRQCRRNAWRCAELSHAVENSEHKQTLIELSRNWLTLALELERNHALMDEMERPPRRA